MDMVNRFMHSRVFRRILREYWKLEGIPAKEWAAWDQVARRAFSDVPESTIKYWLYLFLQCRDTTDQERAEALQLLETSQTAFTEEQRRALDCIFQTKE